MEKQALRSSICFSGTVNEQTVCESRQEVRSTGLRVFSQWKKLLRSSICFYYKYGWMDGNYESGI